MSTTIQDFINTEKSSNCCGSSMYELGDNYICTDCKEHCEAVEDEIERELSEAQKDAIAEQEGRCIAAGCDVEGHRCWDGLKI